MSGWINFAKAKVLAVEDNPMAMEIISQILLGYGVTQADKFRSCAEAAEKISSTAYNLVIVDEMMPDEDGFALVSRIRSNTKGPNFTAPIIMTSANPSEVAVRRARDAGGNFVVAQPLAPGVLLERIHWIASNDRAFVSTDKYCGPDRRFHSMALPHDMPERRAAALQLMNMTDRNLSQDEIDTLF